MSFAAGYLVGRNAEASARSLEEAAASFGRILDRRQQAAQEASALEWCYARIAQWESWADMAMAEIQRLEADLTQSQECLAQSQKYAQWAGPEIERLKAQISGLTARVREFEAADEAERVAVLDNVRRILGGDDDLPLG